MCNRRDQVGGRLTAAKVRDRRKRMPEGGGRRISPLQSGGGGFAHTAQGPSERALERKHEGKHSGNVSRPFPPCSQLAQVQALSSAITEECEFKVAPCTRVLLVVHVYPSRAHRRSGHKCSKRCERDEPERLKARARRITNENKKLNTAR